MNLAEQRASGLQELWRSCKADLAAARLQAAQAHALLTAERAKHRLIRDQNADLLERVGWGCMFKFIHVTEEQ